MVCCCSLAGTKACAGCPSNILWEPIVKHTMIEPFFGWDLIDYANKAHKYADKDIEKHFKDNANE